MAAFIPAGAPHRSIVIGEKVGYQSLYLNRSLIKKKRRGITIFEISELGVALLNRLNLNNREDLFGGPPGQC